MRERTIERWESRAAERARPIEITRGLNQFLAAEVADDPLLGRAVLAHRLERPRCAFSRMNIELALQRFGQPSSWRNCRSRVKEVAVLVPQLRMICGSKSATRKTCRPANPLLEPAPCQQDE
jgi:hypothetical protein